MVPRGLCQTRPGRRDVAIGRPAGEGCEPKAAGSLLRCPAVATDPGSGASERRAEPLSGRWCGLGCAAHMCVRSWTGVAALGRPTGDVRAGAESPCADACQISRTAGHKLQEVGAQRFNRRDGAFADAVSSFCGSGGESRLAPGRVEPLDGHERGARGETGKEEDERSARDRTAIAGPARAGRRRSAT